MPLTSDDELNPEERVRADEEDCKVASEHTTTTGDEVRKQVVRAGERGNLAVVVADILAELADRVDTVDELTPSFHSIARLEARIEALEEKQASYKGEWLSVRSLIRNMDKRLEALEQGD